MAFSADWLALREPADAAARDRALLRQAAALAGDAPLVLDLGCGTGATMRSLAPHLPENARWRLLDSDPALLEHAQSQASRSTQTFQQDLSDIDQLPLDGVTLVTASALLDLVSKDWIVALAARLNVPFYAALSYDGVMRWSPEDARDAEITAAFNRHQQSDKGFGDALGPDAAMQTKMIFEAAGCDVRQAPSPWDLSPANAALQAELSQGIAIAAEEAGAQSASEWGAFRRNGANQAQCVIGHIDILAIPRIMP